MVEALKDETGNWVEDATELKNMAMAYYEEFFRAYASAGGEIITGESSLSMLDCLVL